ncbi:hypothetical protein M9434_001818 [Picochlorum sp. BPE23]|nr:hypothetical protein M9434_001818 [Picochlorum sp. BPE23]KAI8110533.1 hypothetical protein M9435_002207 [Picochlorum sp. BPE23]
MDDQRPVPRPHRCNARLEDFIQALFTLEFRDKIFPTWGNFRRCLASEPGDEPQDAYLMIDDPDRYLDGNRMRRPPK